LTSTANAPATSTNLSLAADAQATYPVGRITRQDRAQVDPIAGREQAPLGPPCEPLTGDSHAHLLAPMQAFAESLGFSVSFEAIPGEPVGGAIRTRGGSWSTGTRR
jgi:hypothetical protein